MAVRSRPIAMKNYRYLEILDRSFNLLTKLRSDRFAGLPAHIQLDWLEKVWLELLTGLTRSNCTHGRVTLHFALGSVLAIGGEIGLQEILISKLEPQNKPKHSIDCCKTLRVYSYVKRLADSLAVSEEEFLATHRKIKLGAIYVLSSAPDSKELTSEVLDYLHRNFWLDKLTAEALVESYAPKTNLVGARFWVKKSRSEYRWATPYEKLGEKIKYLRSECRLSQSELGEKLGLSTIAIFHLEKGDRKLDAVELWLIAKEFAHKSQEFKILAECLEGILGGRSEKDLGLDSNKLSQEQSSVINLYFSGGEDSLKLRSAVRQAIGSISIDSPCLKASRFKPNPKCGIAPYKKLGKNIRLLRIQNGISRSHLSKEAGIAWVAVFHLERGDRRVDIAELLAISKMFAGSSSEFLVLLKCLEKIFAI